MTTEMTETTERSGSGAPLPDHSVIPPVWSRITNLDVDRGEGSWLITRDGERYLDYSSGIGVTNTGHAHPRVAAAIAAQAQKLLHGQQNILYHEPGLRLYDRLPNLLPGVIAAALLAFSLSIDDYVVTAFTSGQTETFPLYIYGSQLRGIPVQVNVIGTMIFVSAVLLVVLTTLWQRRVAARDYGAGV